MKKISYKKALSILQNTKVFIVDGNAPRLLVGVKYFSLFWNTPNEDCCATVLASDNPTVKVFHNRLTFTDENEKTLEVDLFTEKKIEGELK